MSKETFELLWATLARGEDILAQPWAQLVVKQMAELLCREELEPRTQSVPQAPYICEGGGREATGWWASVIHLEKG